MRLPKFLHKVFKPRAEATGNYQERLLEQLLSPVFVGDTLINRDLAVTYATVFRCVTLLSGIIADLITESLRVENLDRDTVKTTHARRALSLLCETPNNETPAYGFIEEIASDYLLDGNSLVRPTLVAGVPTTLQRYDSLGARVIDTSSGRTYAILVIDNSGVPREEIVAASDLAHIRWPQLRKQNHRGRRNGFGVPPVQLVAGAIGVGLNTDAYVREYFGDRTGAGGGLKSKLAIIFEGSTSPTQQKELTAAVEAYTKTRKPLIAFGAAKVQQLDDKPQDNDILKLREFQVREIGRAFGVPAPLLGENVTQWGSGIEQLARLLYRFGAKQHLRRVLSPLSLILLPRGQRFVVDESELVRGDTAAVTALLTAALGDAQRPQVISVREARRVLGLPPELPEDATSPNEAPPAEGMTTENVVNFLLHKHQRRQQNA